VYSRLAFYYAGIYNLINIQKIKRGVCDGTKEQGASAEGEGIAGRGS
jgi:hypothetical protein